jgi:hypothetical protein
MPGCPPRPEGARSAGSRLLIAVHLPSGTASACRFISRGLSRDHPDAEDGLRQRRRRSVDGLTLRDGKLDQRGNWHI